MKILMIMDKNNYENAGKLIERSSVRGIIIKNGKIVMQKNAIGEYKIPGGGAEEGESLLDALEREIKEETGYSISRDKIIELGEIKEIRRDIFDENCKYICHSYFYLCETCGEQGELKMTEHEKEVGFTCVEETVDNIINSNDIFIKNGYWNTRDTEFIRMIKKGMFPEINEKELK